MKLNNEELKKELSENQIVQASLYNLALARLLHVQEIISLNLQTEDQIKGEILLNDGFSFRDQAKSPRSQGIGSSRSNRDGNDISPKATAEIVSIVEELL